MTYKNLLQVSAILVTLLIQPSCSDKCSDVTCQNGGICNEGDCECLSGYTGTNCETKICDKNNTALVMFENKTGTSQTYSVIWDGVLTTTLAPGSQSGYYTVAAGPHTLEFLISNSTTEACTESTPVLVECTSMNYWCTL